MWRDDTFRRSCWRRLDDIAKRSFGGWPSEASGLPFPKIVLNAAVNRSSKYKPRLPHRPWHYADTRKFLMSSLRTVSAAHRHHEPRNLASAFQPRFCQRARDNIGKQGIAGDNHIRTGYQYREQYSRPCEKEFLNCTNIVYGKYRKSGKRRAFGAVKRWWDSPIASSSCAQLALLLFRVLEQTVRRIRDHRMDAELLSLGEPFEAVPMHQGRTAEAMLLHRLLSLR